MTNMEKLNIKTAEDLCEFLNGCERGSDYAQELIDWLHEEAEPCRQQIDIDELLIIKKGIEQAAERYKSDPNIYDAFEDTLNGIIDIVDALRDSMEPDYGSDDFFEKKIKEQLDLLINKRIVLREGGYEFNEEDGTLKVDKSVFDDFVKNSIIGINFIDENAEITYKYQMKLEDDDWVYMEFVG